MKHFLELDHFKDKELQEILAIAKTIKGNPSEYYSVLKGKTLGLIFEKPSNRTRISFAVGMEQLGGSSLYLAPSEIQLGKREEIRDVSRTLSRFMSAVVMRTYSHDTLTEFADHATIPVINGLTDYSHPCQAMADYMTLSERFDNLENIKFAYVGDGNNVLNSLLFLFSKLGVSVSLATPIGYEPQPWVLEKTKIYAKKSGASISVFDKAEEAVKDADVVYTDVFISMGEEDRRDEKLRAFEEFQVNEALLKHAKKGCLVMHCLPAHRGEEITDDVIESKNSIVFDQAENRLHAQKGILYWLLHKGA